MAENPFQPPRRDPSPPHEHSVFSEPHLVGEPFESDPAERLAGRGLDPLDAAASRNDQVEHTIWEEWPTGLLADRPRPADAPTYRRWLEQGIAETSQARSWWVCGGLCVAAGPVAVIGTFMSGRLGNLTWGGVIMICLIGPMTEEIMKAASALWVAEKRPYLFHTARQILLVMAASGLLFAAIENGLYLHVYIKDPAPELRMWRWTACVALHVGCSLISGIGIATMWRATMRDRLRPQLAVASPWVFSAFVLHALYNSAVVIYSAWSSA